MNQCLTCSITFFFSIAFKAALSTRLKVGSVIQHVALLDSKGQLQGNFALSNCWKLVGQSQTSSKPLQI